MDPLRALVTGGAGFLGRHFARELHDRGWAVHRIDGSELDPADDARDLWRYYGDRQLFDLVVHCAAVGPNRVDMAQRRGHAVRNVHLDTAVLDWAATTHQGRLLYVSSPAVYPVMLQTADTAAVPLKEEHTRWSGSFGPGSAHRPDGWYGTAKLIGEKFAELAREELGLSVTIVRPFSGYGEDQDPDHFPFPAIVRRVVRDRDYTVWGPPGQTRDWIHVDDLVRGALAAVEAKVDGPVNLCTGHGTEFGDLVRLVARLAGHGVQEPVYDASMPTGVMRRVGSPTRMLEFYEPRVSIEEGVRRAIERLRDA